MVMKFIIKHVVDAQIGGAILDVNVTPHGVLIKKINFTGSVFLQPFVISQRFNMTKKISIFLISFLLTFRCCAIEISSEESLVLESFFHQMLRNSEGGFVLYNTKPICINGFYLHDCFTGENEGHRSSVDLREGASKWKNLNLDKLKQNIIIHCYNNEDILARRHVHILFINKKLFLSVVEKNLPLFQYVLGPDVTPIGLLNQLTDPNNSFHEVLKEDKVLIGILLGFGTQNSLYVSRVENIEANLLTVEQLPFKSQLSKLGDIRPEYREMFLLADPSLHTKFLNEQPSFGYQSLKEEMQELMKKLDVSSQKLARQSPGFIFGRLKDDKETNQLVNDLEKAQDKIAKLNTSKKFLLDVLQLIFPKEKIVIQQPIHTEILFDNREMQKFPFLVAANIWQVIENENELFKKSFFQGMSDAEKNMDSQDFESNTLTYEKNKVLVKAKQNIQEANEYFHQISKDSNFISVLPLRLYYKITKEGNGLVLDNQASVTIHYTIKTPDNKILLDTMMGGQPNQLSLMDTIPGFAWGVKGMKIGEQREILIHPSLAYGIYTLLEKGIYLKVNAQLVDMNKDEKSDHFPKLIELELMQEISPTIDEDFLQQTRQVGYITGYQVWQHYKKEKSYQLPQVMHWLKQFEKGEDVDISDAKFQDLINRLHWSIYHAN